MGCLGYIFYAKCWVDSVPSTCDWWSFIGEHFVLYCKIIGGGWNRIREV